MRKLTIAVDGPGSAGKGTVARGVARELGYQYVDTGAMYRSVALIAAEAGIAWDDEDALSKLAGSLRFRFGWDGDVLRIQVDGRDLTASIRTRVIGTGASLVSKLPGVRAALLALQRGMGAEGGVVMDGRDIGTVVLPDSDLKIYLDAALDERARRRQEELIRRGESASYEQVLQSLEARDRQDMEREIAPLRRADDAVLVDTTDMTIPQATRVILALARERGA